jgi:hypothetical protein
LLATCGSLSKKSFAKLTYSNYSTACVNSYSYLSFLHPPAQTGRAGAAIYQIGKRNVKYK